MRAALPTIPSPRKQVWATWILAFAPWSFGIAMAAWVKGPPLLTDHEWFVWGLVAMAMFGFSSPLAWFLLRRIPAFRVRPRLHSMQIAIWFSGVGGVPAIAAVAAALGGV